MIKHLLTAHMFPYSQFIINNEQQKIRTHTNNAHCASSLKYNLWKKGRKRGREIKKIRKEKQIYNNKINME